MSLLLAAAIALTALAAATSRALANRAFIDYSRNAPVRYRRNSAGARIVQHVPDRVFTFLVEGVMIGAGAALAVRG